MCALQAALIGCPAISTSGDFVTGIPPPSSHSVVHWLLSAAYRGLWCADGKFSTLGAVANYFQILKAF